MGRRAIPMGVLRRPQDRRDLVRTGDVLPRLWRPARTRYPQVGKLANLVSDKPSTPEATVERHLANIYPKIGVASRGEAARKALHENWITIGEITEEEDEEEGQR